MPDRSPETTPPHLLPADALPPSEWEQEMRPPFPKGRQEQARTWRAFTRAREIRHPADLLRGLLNFVRCVRSFRQLGWWSVRLSLADVSEAAWCKWLGQARAWLAWRHWELLGNGACLGAPLAPL